MNFYAGQKVAVKDDRPGFKNGLPFPHRKGEVVEIAEVGLRGLVSLTSQPRLYWSATRFRPLTGFDILDELRRDAEAKTKAPEPA